jgi:CheY-like chemotaxis protein
VFDLFVRGDALLERSEDGLGIGLTLVRDLVVQHGGSVQARSDGLGHGSEFEVRLPVAADAGEAGEGQGGSDEHVAPGARRILVVDDHWDSARSMAMLLELSGHEICVAHDGVGALEMAEEFHPNLVLLDIGLPKMSGYDVARRIRQQPWGANMVLVALTGWGQEDDRRKSTDAGFDEHLVKPVDHARLLRLLATYPAGG